MGLPFDLTIRLIIINDSINYIYRRNEFFECCWNMPIQNSANFIKEEKNIIAFKYAFGSLYEKLFFSFLSRSPFFSFSLSLSLSLSLILFPLFFVFSLLLYLSFLRHRKTLLPSNKNEEE